MGGLSHLSRRMAMMIPKDIEHEPKASAQAMITTTLINKERQEIGVEYTEGIAYKDELPVKGKMIDPYKVQISRATSELAGAYPFLFNVISFVLTHEEYQIGYEKMKTGFYDSITLPLGVFLDIALGKTEGVKDFLMSEMVKLEKNRPVKVVPFDEKTSVYGQPIVVTIGAEKSGHVKNINRDKRDSKTRIQILFMKCFFRNEHGHIQEPKAVYAKLVEAQARRRKDLAKKEQLQLTADAPSSTALMKPAPMEDPYVQTSAINRVREYLFLHDNGKSDTIHYNVPGLLRHSQPQYIRQSGRSKGLIWHKEEAMSFLHHALAVLQIMYQHEHRGRCITGFRLEENENPPSLEVYFQEKGVSG
jgi:hypothetical protein